MKTFKHTHLSTRYDRSVEVLRKVVSGYTETADIITLTEVDSERREKALRFDKWGVVTGDKTGRDDCGILWDESVWWSRHEETFNVTPYMAGNVGAAVAILEHKATGKRVLFSVIHLPSSVEGNGRVAGGRRDEWYDAVNAWRKKCKALARKYKTRRMVLVADWNLNLKARWVRTVVRGLFPLWKFTWDVSKLPAGGTHGSRLIDFTITKGRIKVARRPRIHRSHPVSDHRGYDEVLEL